MSTTTPPRRTPPRRTRRPAGGWAPALTPQTAVRIAIFGSLVMVALGVILVRLWFLQVIAGERYAERADGNRLREVITQPPRGNIVTRDGVTLVTNTTGYDIVARPRDLTGVRRERVLARLATKIDRPAGQLAEAMAKGEENNPLQPVVLARNIDPPLYRYMAEHRRDFPGISMPAIFLRAYPQGQLAAHALGGTSAITAEQLADYRKRDYAGDETVGSGGLEQQYEDVLRGRPGRSVLEVDAMGEPVGSRYLSSTSPTPGRDLHLSIDSGTQRALESALAGAVASSPTANGAAGVAMDPDTGEVLAIASYPTFDPEAFVQRRPAVIERLFNDPRKPINDRAIAGVYPAGSTFKAITAAAALRSGIITPDTLLESRSEIVLHKQEFRNFRFESHGDVNLATALEVSSDTFFYQVADELWRRQLRQQGEDYAFQREARRFGFGRPTGIDLPGESAALLPTPAWKRQRFAGADYSDFQRSWVAGDTIQLGVGQGFLQVTPTQLAVAFGAIANGGTIHVPRVAREVTDPSGRVVQRLTEASPTRGVGITPDNLAAIRRGLYEAANGVDGTAASVFRGLPDDKRVAGKTGTVETGVPGQQDHSWFVGYAPYDAPSIVISVVIENGGTGANAAAPAVCRTLAANLAFSPNLCGAPEVSR